MPQNKEIPDNINVLLSKDRMREKFEELMEKYPNARYCLFAVVTDGHGCDVDHAGYISGLEYLGLGEYLLRFCNECFEMITEDSEDGK